MQQIKIVNMTFSDLNLNKSLLNALADMGYTQPTPIQEKGFSVAMSGRNMVGIAQTGTGKTLAYLLPCLRQWTFVKEKHPQILIIVPTRELVVQIVEEVEKLTKYMNVRTVGIYGGANINLQIAELRLGLDVLVATPGRLLDMILKRELRTRDIKKLVIDEVDEMMSLGFRPQLVRVLDFMPPIRQNLMFSATMTDEVDVLIRDFFENPQIVEAAPTGTPLENIDQFAYNSPNFNSKANLLEHLLAQKDVFTKVLIFVSSKRLADQLFERIHTKFPDELGVIHSNKSQNHRFSTVNSFKDGTYRCIIATDIIARGVDISEVSHVINFDTPDEAENYIHRIGRTGRADKHGISITFVNEKEQEYQEAIETLMDRKITMEAQPENVEISTELTEDEIPKIIVREIQLKKVKYDPTQGGAFHEKLAKNKKVNVTRAEKNILKYGKANSRKKRMRK